MSDVSLDDLRRESATNFMQSMKGETVEVPVNLLYILMQYLDSSRCLLDEGRVPYPSMQWSAFALSHLLETTYFADKKRDGVPGVRYAVYDMLHEANIIDESSCNIESIQKWIDNGEIE